MNTDLTLTTPALLFPAISLLLLAYTSRFLTLANLMRDLYSRYKAQPDPKIRGQIANLKYRIVIIRNMQVAGVSSFFLCVLCMFAMFIGQILGILADEDVLGPNGLPDIEKTQAILYGGFGSNHYFAVGEKLGEAFSVGENVNKS